MKENMRIKRGKRREREREREKKKKKTDPPTQILRGIKNEDSRNNRSHYPSCSLQRRESDPQPPSCRISAGKGTQHPSTVGDRCPVPSGNCEGKGGGSEREKKEDTGRGERKYFEVRVSNILRREKKVRGNNV